MVGVPDPLDGFGVERAAVSGGHPGGVQHVHHLVAWQRVQPGLQCLLGLDRVQRARFGRPRRVEFMDMPAKPVDGRGALGDKDVAGDRSTTSTPARSRHGRFRCPWSRLPTASALHYLLTTRPKSHLASTRVGADSLTSAGRNTIISNHLPTTREWTNAAFPGSCATTANCATGGNAKNT